MFYRKDGDGHSGHDVAERKVRVKGIRMHSRNKLLHPAGILKVMEDIRLVTEGDCVVLMGDLDLHLGWSCMFQVTSSGNFRV